MRVLKRFSQRVLILGLGIFSVWLIVFVVFETADRRALSMIRAQDTWGGSGFWLNTDRPPDSERVLWVGAGTRDTGLSLTRLTFQITHATESDTNAERDYIIAELMKSRSIEAAKVYQSGQDLLAERVNHYVTDGEIMLASLVVNDT
jgi:hypothetical protein